MTERCQLYHRRVSRGTSSHFSPLPSHNICQMPYHVRLRAAGLPGKAWVLRLGRYVTTSPACSYVSHSITVGRLSYVLWVYRCLTRPSRFSPEFHQNSPESHQNFAGISNWSTLKKGLTTTRPSHARHSPRSGRFRDFWPGSCRAMTAASRQTRWSAKRGGGYC